MMESGPRSRALGLLLLTQFAILLAIKIHVGLLEDMFWLSHVCLLMAGVGCCLGRPLLYCTALTCLLGLHTLWLVDWALWQWSGSFPLGLTTYLQDGGFLTWLGTAHHFYLVPLLLVMICRRRVWPKETLLLSVALFLVLTVISRAFLSAAGNVNCAFGVPVNICEDLLARVHRLNGGVYLLALSTFVFVVFLVPANALGRRLARRGEPARRNRVGLQSAMA